MASIRCRKASGNLFFDFRYKGKRCREQTLLKDTPANNKKLKQVLERIEAEITLGSFDYATYFPNSTNAKKFPSIGQSAVGSETPLFKDFAQIWADEMAAEWRSSHYENTMLIFRKYIFPEFGQKEVGHITKVDILNFRSKLAKVTKKNGDNLSATRINHIITPLRMILNEAANRFEFTSPYHGIKSLKVKKVDIEPFTLDEVKLILKEVREDYRNYITIRFFTGLRSSEINGLQWKFVDFERKQILIRHAWVVNELIYTKNDGSFRTVDMSELVYKTLQSQKEVTGSNDFVFCSKNLTPLGVNNFANRIWRPLLNYLDIRYRRPYSTRHTAATLWLAAGESPEWIARQMGHTTTEMLFSVYSRFVPNLTRQDGTAMERLLSANGLTAMEESDDDNVK